MCISGGLARSQHRPVGSSSSSRFNSRHVGGDADRDNDSRGGKRHNHDLEVGCAVGGEKRMVHWPTFQHSAANLSFTPMRGLKREWQVFNHIDPSAIGPLAGERKNIGLAFIGDLHFDIPVERGA